LKFSIFSLVSVFTLKRSQVYLYKQLIKLRSVIKNEAIFLLRELKIKDVHHFLKNYILL